MKRLALASSLLGVLLLSGCAPTMVCKAGGGDFEKDNYDCRLRAHQMAQFGDVYNPYTENSELKACLRSKGWAPCEN